MPTTVLVTNSPPPLPFLSNIDSNDVAASRINDHNDDKYVMVDVSLSLGFCVCARPLVVILGLGGTRVSESGLG